MTDSELLSPSHIKKDMISVLILDLTNAVVKRVVTPHISGHRRVAEYAVSGLEYGSYLWLSIYYGNILSSGSIFHEELLGHVELYSEDFEFDSDAGQIYREYEVES